MNEIQVLSDESTLKPGVAAEIVDKMIAKWQWADGEILDFGGGEKDLMCADVMRFCDGKATKLQRAFGLSKSEAKLVIDYCNSPF